MRLGFLAAAWLAGVLLGFETILGPEAAWLLAGAAVAAALGMCLARLPAFPAVLAAVLLLGLGRAEAHAGQVALHTYHGQEVVASGSIANDPQVAARHVRFELQVTTVDVDGETRAIDHRWLVYAIPPEELVSRRVAPHFRYGDLVTVKGTPLQPQPINGFDYPAYLAAQGITSTLVR